MSSEDTSAYIDAAARIQGLTIDPAWKPNVVRFFEIARTMAERVEATGALTDAEGAPVFSPRARESGS